MKKYNSREISSIIIHNFVVIVIFALIGAISFLGFAKYKRTTEYTAQSNVMIGHNLNRSNSKAKQTNADLNRIKSYEDIIEDPVISRKVHSNLTGHEKKKVSVDGLNRSIKVTTSFNSLVLKITAKATSAQLATHIVNATAKSTQQELPKIVPDAGQVLILSKAKSSEAVSHTRPSLKKYGLVGFALGALVGMVIAFVWTSWKQLLDTK